MLIVVGIITNSVQCQVPASIVTDAKSLHDGVEKRELFSAGLQDRRSGIQVVAIRQQVGDQNINVRWTNSDQQIADGLTKMSARPRLIRCLRSGHLRLQHDPAFVSAKEIRRAHADKIESGEKHQPTPWRIPTRAEAEDMIVKLQNDVDKTEKEIARILMNVEKLKVHPNGSEDDISSLEDVSEVELA